MSFLRAFTELRAFFLKQGGVWWVFSSFHRNWSFFFLKRWNVVVWPLSFFVEKRLSAVVWRSFFTSFHRNLSFFLKHGGVWWCGRVFSSFHRTLSVFFLKQGRVWWCGGTFYSIYSKKFRVLLLFYIRPYVFIVYFSYVATKLNFLFIFQCKFYAGASFYKFFFSR
jgi:hypothetical protein